MTTYIAILLAVYFFGMFVVWFGWRAKVLAGWWFQDGLTLLLWPLVVVVVCFVLLSKRHR